MRRRTLRQNRLHKAPLLVGPLLAWGLSLFYSSFIYAAPYASHLNVSGTTVTFVLNEPAPILSYRINGGAPIMLDGTTKGTKTFSLGAPSDRFSITSEKLDSIGYTIPSGGTVDYSDPSDPTQRPHGLYDPSPLAGLRIISDDASVLTRFYAPRGVGVSTNPNTPNFGTAYISNSNTPDLPEDFPERPFAEGRGLFALRADGSDAFGQGNVASNPDIDEFPAFQNNNNGPFKTTVAADGTPYVADWSDGNGSLIRYSRDLASAVSVFSGFGGSTPLPPGQNHGSVGAVYVEGAPESGDLNVYTLDEDITTNFVTGSGSDEDQNSLWRYNVGAGPLPSSVTPTKLADVLEGYLSPDLARGADGKWYVMQLQEQQPDTATLFVLSPDASTVLYDSLSATRALKNDPLFSQDILQNSFGMAVSPDQKWVALILGGSDVAVLPLVDGIPQLDDRMVVKSAVDVFNENSGRDIDFDAAGNIHYVSSGQGRYRVLSPGGRTVATTAWDGTQYAFEIKRGDTADFNGDGTVDGADLLAWQRGLGGVNATLWTGDANGDGSTNAADLAIWRSQFGSGGLATANVGSVPEPSAAVLATFLLGLRGWSQRRRATSPC